MTPKVKKNDPLTVDEMTAAAEVFMPLYKVIESQLPKATVEDTLKVMEAVAKLGHKLRSDQLLKDKELSFGFNKNEESKGDKD